MNGGSWCQAQAYGSAKVPSVRALLLSPSIPDDERVWRYAGFAPVQP